MLHFQIRGHSFFTIRTDPKSFFFFQALKRKKTHGKKTLASVTVTVVRDTENPDRAKNQSDCSIRHHARLEKHKASYLTFLELLTNSLSNAEAAFSKSL